MVFGMRLRRMVLMLYIYPKDQLRALRKIVEEEYR